MNVTVRTHHLEITDALKEYAQEKIGKLTKYMDSIQDFSVELDVIDASDEDHRQHAHGIVWCAGKIFRGEASSPDMYASIDQLYDKLEVQLRRYKDKQKDKSKRGESIREIAAANAAPSPEKNNVSRPNISAHYIPKPVGAEDAVMYLEEHKLNFVVYRNIPDEKINVLYPLPDGRYAVLEP
jgi:putative sigma-54 modulation protein